MAQQWWALDELGDLGELDALLSGSGAEGGCRAAPVAASKCPEGSSGAPLTPSEADGEACAVAPGVGAVTAPAPSASGDGACETEPVGVDSAADPTAAQPGSPPPAQKLRCLDERHPATCTRCVPPPEAAVLHLYKLTGDPQKKNGEKKLRSLLTRTVEWQDAGAREKLAAELESTAMGGADAAGTAQLARALLERDCAGLRKQSMVLLARVWGYRADIWQRLPEAPPAGGRSATSSASDGDAVGSKRKRERRSRAQQRTHAAAAAAALDDDDAWHAGLAKAARMWAGHTASRRGTNPVAASPYDGFSYGMASPYGAPPPPPPNAEIARLRDLVRCALAPLARDAARAWAGEAARRALASASPEAAAALCAVRLGDNAALLRVTRKAAAWAGAQHAALRGARAHLASGAAFDLTGAWPALCADAAAGTAPAAAVLRAVAQLLLAGGADARAARARDAAAEADRLFAPAGGDGAAGAGHAVETDGNCHVGGDAAAAAALLTWQAELDGGVAGALRWVQGAQRAAASLRGPAASSNAGAAPYTPLSFADFLEASDLLCELAFAFLTAVAAAFAHRRSWMVALAGAEAASAPSATVPLRCERLMRLMQPPAPTHDAAAEQARAAWATAVAATAQPPALGLPLLQQHAEPNDGLMWPELPPPPQGRWMVA